MIGHLLRLGVVVSPSTMVLSFTSFFSFGLIGAMLLGVDLSWLPPYLLVVALVFFGSDADQLPRHWAWVPYDPGEPLTWLVPGGLLALGSASYAFRDAVGLSRTIGVTW